VDKHFLLFHGGVYVNIFLMKNLKEKISSVPETSGVYMFLDKKGRVLYIGKAKNLKARLRSYLQISEDTSPRIKSMLQKVADVSFIATDNELEALALEASLIKQQKPRYNIVLRDDKNYPYLRLDPDEQWPKLEVVRRIKKDGALYFGPYIPASAVWETLAFVRKYFSIRPCRYDLSRPRKPCISYQMGRCPAPCAGLVTRQQYMRGVEEVVHFLRGQKEILFKSLQQKMKLLAEQLRFEEAAKVRDSIQALKRAFEKQKVVDPEMGDIDVIGLYREGSDALVMVLFLRKGMLIGTKDFHLKNTQHEEDEILLEEFMKFFYAKDTVLPEKILLPVLPREHYILQQWLTQKKGSEVSISIATDSKQKELLKMAEENARLRLQSRLGKTPKEVLRNLKDLLQLPKVPESIGAFDVSTIFGSYSVGAFIWWEDGQFVKDLYRHLKIKTVQGIDDYAMMREIVQRTLKNLSSVPDLIVIDGGKGQLDVAMEAAKAVLGDDFRAQCFVAIAKGPDRAVLSSGRAIPIDDTSAESILLRKIRDEVHRFAISFHRKLRAKELFRSPLEEIPSIGPKRRLALLRRFGSLEAIRKASVEELASVDGMNRTLAEKVLEYLNKHAGSR